MRSIRKRFGCVLAALTMVFTGIAASSVSAASAGKQITIIPNSDVQPFIRQYLPKSLFGSGGPFYSACPDESGELQKDKGGRKYLRERMGRPGRIRVGCRTERIHQKHRLGRCEDDFGV